MNDSYFIYVEPKININMRSEIYSKNNLLSYYFTFKTFTVLLNVNLL